MSLTVLRLQNVRSLEAAELHLHPQLNLVTGANGSGKTSLLEAAYLLGRGRSFRTRHTEQLVRQGAETLWVAGRLDLNGLEHRVDLQCDRARGVTGRIDGQAVASLASLAETFPIQVIDPGIHRLVEEGPARRRRWLDWAVFHVEHGFIDRWQRYGRALRQRNAALVAHADPAPWEAELSRLGELLSGARARVMEALQPFWAEALQTLDAAPVTLSFERGWPPEQALDQCLSRQRDRDREQRRTRLGPHRFDVVLRLGDRPARDVVSRGQQKLLGAAMILALAAYVARTTGRVPALLLDDPAAELDDAHTRALLAAAGALGGQRIVTALRPDELPVSAADRVFHVEHGRVKTL